MRDAPKVIYRNPAHAATKPAKHEPPSNGGKPPQARTIDPKRLANAGAIQSIPVRRRALVKRAAFMVFLLLIALAVVVTIIASAEETHAQSPVCYVSSPVLPAQNICLQARVYVPIVAR